MKPLTIFRGSTGLNTKIDPTRLYSSGGIKDLAVAGDVDVSDTGRISRRKGYTKQTSDSVHSLFCDGGDCLCASGTDLCLVNPDYSLTVLTTITANAQMSCTQINDRIYWCNGNEKGYVAGQVNNSWVKGSYVGPEIKRNLSDPPIGTIVAYYRNRIYIAQNNVLWYSEPGAFGAFDLARGFFMFATGIRMVQAVENGIYVSSGNNTYFLRGNSPKTFDQIKIASYPAIQGTDHKLNGTLIERTIVEGNGISAMWLSNEGVCYGGDEFKNLTLDKIADFPDGLTGSGLVYRGRYVGLINP